MCLSEKRNHTFLSFFHLISSIILFFPNVLYLYPWEKIVPFELYVVRNISVWFCLFQDLVSLCWGIFKFRNEFITFRCAAFDADVAFLLIICTSTLFHYVSQIIEILYHYNKNFWEYKWISKQNEYINTTLRNEEYDWVFRDGNSFSIILIDCFKHCAAIPIFILKKTFFIYFMSIELKHF